MGRRRAVLIVEYMPASVMGNDAQVPDAERWERVFGGSGVKDLRVHVEVDRAWP